MIETAAETTAAYIWNMLFMEVKFVGNKAKARQIFRKTNISYPLCVYREVRNARFFGKFGVLCFLVTPVLRFAFLPY